MSKKTQEKAPKKLKFKRKIGKAPGTITYMGNRDDNAYALTVIDYTENEISFKQLANVKEALVYKDSGTVSWINICGLSNVKEIENIGHHFNLNPLLLEDAVNTNQRPKIDEYDNCLFAVFKMMYLKDDQEIVSEHVALVLLENTVLVFQEVNDDVFNGIRNRLENKFGRIRSRKADYLFFALIDAIIDEYFVILEDISQQIEALENEVYNHPSQITANKIQTLKKLVLNIRKTILPTKELINRLISSSHPLIAQDTKLFLRDAQDHSIQLHENIELYREMTMNLMEAYMTNMSNKMNEVMKVLTIIATIFIPLSFLAGVYGMNFKHIPELESPYGYYVFWGVSILIFIALLIFFKRKKWF